MEHLLLKATVAAVDTDQGTFEAVISTSNADREKDVVSPAAMVAALHKWNRPLPLAWNHSTAAEDIFGTVDPRSAYEVDGEVIVKGQVDLSSTVGQEAWRSFKNGTIGFSYGYLILEATNRKGGGRNITALDVFEITATPTPMNNDTRVLSLKALLNADPLTEELVVETIATELKAVADRLPETNLPQDAKDRLAQMAQRMLDVTKSVEETGNEEPREARSVDSLRDTALSLALDIKTRGLSAQPPQKQAPPAKPKPEMDPDELRSTTRALLVQVLSKTEESEQ